MSLYDELKAAGCPMDSHESDLYVYASPEAVAILERHPERRSVTKFYTDTVEPVGWWLDIPFAYAPWWRKRGCTA